MQGSIGVELSGGIVVARIRGEPTEPLLKDCQERVLVLLRDTACRKILYDALELEAPPVEVALVQQRLSEEIHALGVRVAIVVPNSRIAYLSRLAFGQGDHRVFYSDLVAAIHWLTTG